MRKNNKNTKKKKDAIQSPITYFVITAIGAFGFYNWFGFSLYHWIANFTTRTKALGGVFPKELYPMLALSSAIILLIIGLYRFSKTKDIPVFWLGASALSAFLTTLLSASSLKLTAVMVAESFAIVMTLLALLAAVGTVLIRSIKNYMTLNAGFQLVPLLFVAPAIMFLWWWSQKHDLTGFVVGTTFELVIIPVITIGYLLAKFARKSSGTLVGTVDAHVDGDHHVDDNLIHDEM